MVDAKVQASPESVAIKGRAIVFSALLAAGALTGGCASTRVTAPYELGRAPASELMGLTQDEIMQRLGGHPSGAFYFDSIKLEDEERVSSVLLFRLGEGSCPRNFRNRLAVDLPEYGLVTVGVFRQERLAGLTVSDKRDLPLDTMVVLSCVEREPREAMDADALAMWTFYAPLIVILSPAIALTLPDTLAEERRRRELLASVRLGEPLPGGAEGFVDAYGGSLRIVRDGGDTRIDDLDGLSITLRDDRVQAIDRGYHLCRLTSEAALDCD